MKTKLLIAILLFAGFASKGQNETAFNYYTINQSIGGKDVYLFTTPKPFKYTKGSGYAFAPVQYDKIAQRSIENKLKSMDISFNGLYVNQISNGTRTSFKNFQATNQEINDKMIEIYNYQKSQNYHREVVILLIDIDSGAALNGYLLPATSVKTNSGNQGNAY